MNKEIKQEIIETINVLNRGLLNDLKNLRSIIKRNNPNISKTLHQIEAIRDKCSKAKRYILKVYENPTDYFETENNGDMFSLIKYGIEGYCDRFLISDDVRGKALEILRICSKTNIFSRKKKDSMIAAILYASGLKCNKKIEQKVLAFNLGVNEMTIRNNYRFILKEIETVV